MGPVSASGGMVSGNPVLETEIRLDYRLSATRLVTVRSDTKTLLSADGRYR